MTAVAELVVPTGIQIPDLEPGSDVWLQHMSASKVAAVLGLSPYESRFSLWHRMANLIPSEPDNPQLKRGHYLEPGVCAWFADQHPDWSIYPAGSWRHAQHERYTAAPDRLAALPSGEVRGVEVKTAADTDEWGQAGTDEIPVGVRAQVMWQMDVVGTRVTHVAVLSAYLDLREYVVTYDADEAAFIREQCQEFLDSLPTGPRPQRPDIDQHDATYEAIRQLHPDIEDRKAEIESDVALRYLAAVSAATAATAELTQAKALLLDQMANARRAVYLDRQIAIRKPARGGSVALQCTEKDMT